jgi:hypothetical protein
LSLDWSPLFVQQPRVNSKNLFFNVCPDIPEIDQYKFKTSSEKTTWFETNFFPQAKLFVIRHLKNYNLTPLNLTPFLKIASDASFIHYFDRAWCIFSIPGKIMRCDCTASDETLAGSKRIFVVLLVQTRPLEQFTYWNWQTLFILLENLEGYRVFWSFCWWLFGHYRLEIKGKRVSAMCCSWI